MNNFFANWYFGQPFFSGKLSLRKIQTMLSFRFTYDDQTCEYRCMATEYVYWGMSAYVGRWGKGYFVQSLWKWLCLSIAGRKSSIAKEWRFSTRAELLAGDVKLSAILQALRKLSPSIQTYSTNLPKFCYRTPPTTEPQAFPQTENTELPSPAPLGGLQVEVLLNRRFRTEILDPQ